MKLRVLSDTHIESYDGKYNVEWHNQHPEFDKIIEKLNHLIPSVDKDEVLVLPGDLGIVADMEANFNPAYEKLLHYFKSRWDYIVIVPGNGEYHGVDNMETLVITENVLSEKCKEMGIIYLQKGVAKIDNYFFVGCTLWKYLTPKEWKEMKKIDKEIFLHPIMVKAFYVDHLTWMDEILTELNNQGQKAVVITHYPPETMAKNPKFKYVMDHGENPAYHNHIDTFIHKHNETIKLWICGDRHDVHRLDKCGVPIYLNALGESWDKHAKPNQGLIEIDD